METNGADRAGEVGRCENIFEARERLAAAIQRSPDNGELRLALGQVEMSLENYEAARAAFASAVLHLPKAAVAHSSLALACQKLGRSNEAARAAIRAISLDPSDMGGLKALARIHLSAGQHEAAQQACRLILRRDARDAEGLEMMEEALAQEAKLAENLMDGRPWLAASPAAAPPRLVPAPGAAHSPEQARRDLERYTAAGQDYFADVLPPQLSDLHLKNSRVLPSREAILPLLPKGLVCAEVGTQTGCFAKKILSLLQPSRLHIYDLDFTPFDHAHFESALREGVVELHQGDSAEMMAAMPDRHFDFIYIDGDHSYTGVVRDLEQAALKIKSDGWIVCNDYTVFSPLEGIKYGVCRAVNEFCLRSGYEIIYLALHPWGYHDVALRKRPDGHLGGAFLEEPDEHTFMPDIWEYLIGKYKVASVLDVGAGGGWSTKWFADHGLFAQGVEGWKEALEKSQCRSLIIEHDFSRGEFVPAHPFDLAWCSEFVEHIEERFVPNFMSAFRACKYVCLTHGEVGQIGYHHVNCQSTEYWIAKMKANGFEHDPQETEYLRSTNIHDAPWGRKTLTFFVNLARHQA